MNKSTAREVMRENLGLLTREEKRNLKFHKKRGTGVIVGERCSYDYVAGDGYG